MRIAIAKVTWVYRSVKGVVVATDSKDPHDWKYLFQRSSGVGWRILELERLHGGCFDGKVPKDFILLLPADANLKIGDEIDLIGPRSP